jgi:hypothetical protein
VAQEAGGIRVVDRVENAVHGDLAVVLVSLDRGLYAVERLLCEADLAADPGHLRWQVELVQDVFEGAADAVDALADVLHGRAELVHIPYAVGEFGGVRQRWLDPHGEAHALRRPWGGRVEIHPAEARMFRGHLLLHETAPVLVLALDHRLQTGGACPVLLCEQCDERAHREVPVADDRVDRFVEAVQRASRPVDQVRYGHLAVLEFLDGQQRMEAQLFGAGNGPQGPQVGVIETDDEYVPGTWAHGRLQG